MFDEDAIERDGQKLATIKNSDDDADGQAPASFSRPYAPTAERRAALAR